VQTGSVREGDLESSQCAGNDPDCRWPVSAGLIDDPQPRGFGLKLVVANFRKQNQGLGLHDVLLSLSSGPVACQPLAGPSIAAGMQR
jgi:hypothetical protein